MHHERRIVPSIDVGMRMVAVNLSSPEPAAQGKNVLVRYFFFCFLGGVTGRPVFTPP